MIRETKWTEALKREYEEIFATAKLRRERIGELDRSLDLIVEHLPREYAAVSSKTGVPPIVVGCIHLRESSLRFTRHLHNGDPLTARTRQVPSGRPVKGNPPFTWEASAIDALTMPPHSLHQWSDWSIGGMCYVFEKFNGFGYRKYHNINSPYLWGFTTAYTLGLYVSDGRWSDTAVNANPGTMAIIMRAIERGIISPVGAQSENSREEARDYVMQIQEILRKSGDYTGAADALFRRYSVAGLNSLLRRAGEPTSDQWDEWE